MNDNTTPTMAQVFEAMQASINAGICSPETAQQFLAARQQQQRSTASDHQQASPFLMHTNYHQQQQQQNNYHPFSQQVEERIVLSPSDAEDQEADHNRVKHDYHDRSGDPDGDYVAIHEMLQKSGGACVDQSFPVKLHYMLNEIEKDGLTHIVSWQPHGRCFVVHDQKLFVEQILGCWFRQKKYPSFQRQLNIYGFQRLTTGPDKGGYYHELFLRSKPGLAYRIQRYKLKGTGTRKAASPQTEPNFYAMEPLPQGVDEEKETETSGSQQADHGTNSSRTPSDTTTANGNYLPAGPSAAVTLQNLAPSLFSPASFETTVQMLPNNNNNNIQSSSTSSTTNNQRGFRVTSSCNLTLKHNPGADMNGNSSLAAAPLTLANATNPRLNHTNHSAFLAALNGGNLSLSFGAGGDNNTGAGDLSNNNGGTVNNTNGNPLWFLR